MTIHPCSSPAAIVVHLRTVTASRPVSIGEHRVPYPRALCGSSVMQDCFRTEGKQVCGACDERARVS